MNLVSKKPAGGIGGGGRVKRGGGGRRNMFDQYFEGRTRVNAHIHVRVCSLFSAGSEWQDDKDNLFIRSCSLISAWKIVSRVRVDQ